MIRTSAPSDENTAGWGTTEHRRRSVPPPALIGKLLRNGYRPEQMTKQPPGSQPGSCRFFQQSCRDPPWFSVIFDCHSGSFMNSYSQRREGFSCFRSQYVLKFPPSTMISYAVLCLK